jgi:ABC-type polysaccharide/polyol phosphate transport system ATPase subunit
MEPVIEVDSLGKKFSRNQDRHQSYALMDVLRELVGKRTDPSTLREDEFWAVRDLSFKVFPGEAVALIGRNGCGKTTTLRVIAGLLKPDAGRVVVRGRVQALIALGTGFNPKLSGRENIYNNAAVLGLNRLETNEIIDTIIDFAEIGEFLDSPFSTYSSGMKARLGFSVAVHLNPDILIVDEILGVGDFAFQNKCAAKINEIQQSGVSILLVSHAHQTVRQLCHRAFWLDGGVVRAEGDSADVVEAYLEYLNNLEISKLDKSRASSASPRPAVEKNASPETELQESEAVSGAIEFLPSDAEPLFSENTHGKIVFNPQWVERVSAAMFVNGKPAKTLEIHDRVVLELDVVLRKTPSQLRIGFIITNAAGERVAVNTTDEEGFMLEGHRSFRIRMEVADFNLRAGHYVLSIPIQQGGGLEFIYRQQVWEFFVRGDLRPSVGFVRLQNRMTIENRSKPTPAVAGSHEA